MFNRLFSQTVILFEPESPLATIGMVVTVAKNKSNIYFTKFLLMYSLNSI